MSISTNVSFRCSLELLFSEKSGKAFKGGRTLPSCSALTGQLVRAAGKWNADKAPETPHFRMTPAGQRMLPADSCADRLSVSATGSQTFMTEVLRQISRSWNPPRSQARRGGTARAARAGPAPAGSLERLQPGHRLQTRLSQRASPMVRGRGLAGSVQYSTRPLAFAVILKESFKSV